MNQTTKKAYAERINAVIDYINSHLKDDLSVEQLSRVANFSKYHFHRQFSEYTGISVFKFIQLMRLKRASYQLVFNKEYKIIDIALDAGFENPESFSRAFKKAHKQTPSEFRNKPKWKPWLEKYQFKKHEAQAMNPVNIIEFKETQVATLEHRGSPDFVNNTVSRFIEWRKQSKQSPIHSSQTYGIIYDNPKTTEPEKFKFDICGSINEAVKANPQGVVEKRIPGGRCAVLRYEGPIDQIEHSVYYLYGEWLPGSSEELRDFPCFFHYLTLLPSVPEHENITDIYLPLK